MASLYACFHGSEGLKQIAYRVHTLTEVFATGLERLGFAVVTTPRFDTLKISLGDKRSSEILKAAEVHRVNLRLINDRTIGISVDETTSSLDVEKLWQIFNGDKAPDFAVADVLEHATSNAKHACDATSPYLEHTVFNRFHSETAMLRYIKRLESRDLSLTASMIPLGSCTMKLNAAAEMFPVSWPEIGRIHPFAPIKQTRGYQ